MLPRDRRKQERAGAAHNVLLQKAPRGVFPDTKTGKAQRNKKASDSAGQREAVQQTSGIEAIVFSGQPVPSS